MKNKNFIIKNSIEDLTLDLCIKDFIGLNCRQFYVYSFTKLSVNFGKAQPSGHFKYNNKIFKFVRVFGYITELFERFEKLNFISEFCLFVCFYKSCLFISCFII